MPLHQQLGVVRTPRTECLDWLLIRNRRHLQRVLTVYLEHYNFARPHRSLDLRTPLLALPEPPGYVRQPAGSQVDRFAEAIAAMLAEDPVVPATVIAARLRPAGFTGSLTILKDYLRRVRPTFAVARARHP